LVLAPRARGVVVLALTYADDVLVANWRRGLDGLTWRAPLDTAAHAVHDPDTAALLERVRHVLAGTPAVTAGERVELRNPLALEGLAAAHFVTRTLPLLEAIDGLLVEREGDWPTFREAVASPVITLGGAASDGGDWFDLDVQVTVEGESVPFQTLFTALARGVSHVILPSGTYFALAGGEWGRLRDLIVEARSLSTSRDRTTVSRYQVALWKDLFALGEADERASAWRDALAGLVDDDPEPVEAPASLQATLRPYQLEGLGWLSRLYEAGLGGILADDMGLGKTVQALALVCHADERYRETRPFLVVAPTSVVGNWARECARFAPHLRCTTMVQTAAKSGVALADVVASHDIIITSYNLLRLDATSYQAIDWAGLFLDEAQFAKNHRTLAHETVRGLNVAFKVAMTGTPIENNLTELWALTNIVAPGLFPHVDQFEHYYRTPIERFGDTERLELLRKRLRPFLLRRTKEEVATDLPPKQEQVLSLELEPEHRRAYDTLLAHERQKVLGLLDDLDGNRFEILSSLTRLRQASLDVGLVSEDYAEIPSTKLNALMELLEDVAGDHRVLIFSQFTSFLKRAAERVAAAGLAYCYLDGATTNRQDVIDRFRDGDAPVFLISLKAGGFGLNLTEADYCVMLDPWWNPAAEEQAIDRTHRIGQTRTVMVYRMVGVNTIEEKVMAMKDAKSALFDSVLGDGEYSRASLSAADIRSLLS
jgi:SNF2 family DNA or RNA helicase